MGKKESGDKMVKKTTTETGEGKGREHEKKKVK